MKEYDINTYQDFQKIVSQIQFGRLPFIGEQYQELYRGQSKNSYELKSGISRYAKTADEIKKLEINLVVDFKKLVETLSDYRKIIHLSKNKTNFENDWRWLEQMQHFRIPTRLLDWSLKPEIALFFAVDNHENEIGQFWIYKTPLNWSCDDHFTINPYAENLNIISNSSFRIEEKYKDKIAEHRRSFQAGKFSIQDFDRNFIPMEKQIEMQNLLLKYSINPKSKKKLLEKLAEQNINKSTIYVEIDEEVEKLINELKSKYNF